MVEKGNERAFAFSSVTELTGEEEHERLTELEVIFGPYEDIDAHALRRCANLQRVTLINCRLKRIPVPALRLARESLVHLCLSSQHISNMDALDLPNLRALYLQHNHIERIEGLETCTRLQRLWLCGNRLKRIENLSQCTDLRELWVQDNLIQSVAATESDPGLEELVNLETLGLAKNRIRSIDELQALRKLINLRSLVLADEHFGSNPIVRHPEYRVVAISSLRQLQHLDGTVISQAERAGAVDQFLQEAMAFNDVVAELTLNYELELRAIQTRKERGQSNADMMQRELVEALNEVEQLVVRGTAELEEEKLRQIRLRDQHTQMTSSALKAIQERYYEELGHMLEEELKMMDQEELQCEVQEQEAQAEHNLSLTVAALQCTKPQCIAVEHLTEHSADFQRISVHIHADADAGSVQKVSLLQVYRFYNADLVARFNKSTACHQDRSSEGSLVHLYCIVSEDEVADVLQHGFGGNDPTPVKKWIVLFSNPLLALEFSDGCSGSCEDGTVDAPELQASGERVRSHILVLCEVMMEHVSQVTIGDSTMSQLKTLNSIVSLATVAAQNPAAHECRPDFIHTALRLNQREGDAFIANYEAGLPNVLPQFVVQCSERLVQPTPASSGDQHKHQPESLLTLFAREVDDALTSHHDRLWKEIDPEVWSKKAQFQQEKTRLDREIMNAKERVGDEKRVQKSLLKSARRK